MAVLSQGQQAAASGSTQSQISRLERALAPSMGVDRLVALGDVLGRSLPLGVCPHEHGCPWQPFPPRATISASRLDALLVGSGYGLGEGTTNDLIVDVSHRNGRLPKHAPPAVPEATSPPTPEEDGAA